MNIVFVADRPPFPARDGVTIPIMGLINILQTLGQVTVVITADLGEDADSILLDQKISLGTEVRYLRRFKKHPLIGLFSEIILGKPYFLNWRYPEGFSAIDQLNDVDLVFVSPINAVDIGFVFKTKKNIPVVFAISDVYTSFLRSVKFGHTIKSRIRAAMMRLRSHWLCRIERRILSVADMIIVQTNKDVAWLKNLGGTRLANKGLALSNGVSDSIIELQLRDTPPLPVVLFLATFTDPHYREMLSWFITSVWPSVCENVSNAKLRVVGRGLDIDSALIAAINNDNSIEYLGFVESLFDAYYDVRISVAPIFKDYGLINKVSEALAFGVPVVGDASAFNGIAIPSSSSFAVECLSSIDFSDAIIKFLLDDKLWLDESLNAKKFAYAMLGWDSRREILVKSIEELM